MLPDDMLIEGLKKSFLIKSVYSENRLSLKQQNLIDLCLITDSF